MLLTIVINILVDKGIELRRDWTGRNTWGNRECASLLGEQRSRSNETSRNLHDMELLEFKSCIVFEMT